MFSWTGSSFSSISIYKSLTVRMMSSSKMGRQLEFLPVEQLCSDDLRMLGISICRLAAIARAFFAHVIGLEAIWIKSMG